MKVDDESGGPRMTWYAKDALRGETSLTPRRVDTLSITHSSTDCSSAFGSCCCFPHHPWSLRQKKGTLRFLCVYLSYCLLHVDSLVVLFDVPAHFDASMN